jgi:hypothetical protein
MASGNWMDKTKWTVGRVPFANEYVKINAGHTMVVDQTIQVKQLQLNGKIQFTGPYKVRLG